MKHHTLLSTLLLFALTASNSLAIGAAPNQQKLCGWFKNPTPGNAWLQDRNAEWVVGVQGGHQAEGDWPEFKASQWIETNGSYGYGCACITAVVNGESREVVRIVSARAQPIKVCRSDRKLKAP
jgi:hypothetical protein